MTGPVKAFPEQGMTFTEFTRHVIPGLTDEQANHVLWEHTPFPMAMGRDDLLPYLEKYRDREEGPCCG